ncbi:thiamine pyrophosphokinase [Virgibacillus natechei]|uniref:Thiamine diphosphokinase n=1 Tax=Virgibacillus natechei TaxID=1216297 RepID=A0ABS4IB91_9BACI|nr:thiamine diphosphokinase [Virgibacillus natechei]MBP1968145.1 thiamine pyrophosphokinase [Virgibacillus natechei]UZD14578.1 thiamine diphosphokinase [Virgibacillus natechei]
MVSVAIVGNGPVDLHPDFDSFKEEIDIWIGADRGALTLVLNELPMDYAVGDFDSTNHTEKTSIQENATFFEEYPPEKDETDLEIALLKALELNPNTIYIVGVTGGRLDHELVNIQLLYKIIAEGIRGIIIDKSNHLELTLPGLHTVKHSNNYPTISFIPFTQHVKGLNLEGFKYPLQQQDISWGSTLCISNKLLLNNGTFSYDEGILLLIKSRDTIPM